MPYIKEICLAGNMLEVRKYHTLRYNVKGEKRNVRNKETCDCQKKVNYYEALRKLTRLMAANFTDDTGMLVTLTYLKDKRPGTSTDMQKDIELFLRRIRKVFKKSGLTLKYIYVKELGKRGAAHVHILMSVCDIRIIRDCWDKGGIDAKALWSGGDYSAIAKYFLKYSLETEETEGRLIGKRWYPSRNLKKPLIIKKIVKANTFNMRIKAIDGYVVDPNTLKSGYTEFGYKYLTYTMRKVAPVQV